jgi:hypothetical protein
MRTGEWHLKDGVLTITALGYIAATKNKDAVVVETDPLTGTPASVRIISVPVDMVAANPLTGTPIPGRSIKDAEGYRVSFTYIIESLDDAHMILIGHGVDSSGNEISERVIAYRVVMQALPENRDTPVKRSASAKDYYDAYLPDRKD